MEPRPGRLLHFGWWPLNAASSLSFLHTLVLSHVCLALVLYLPSLLSHMCSVYWSSKCDRDQCKALPSRLCRHPSVSG